MNPAAREWALRLNRAAQQSEAPRAVDATAEQPALDEAAPITEQAALPAEAAASIDPSLAALVENEALPDDGVATLPQATLAAEPAETAAEPGSAAQWAARLFNSAQQPTPPQPTPSQPAPAPTPDPQAPPPVAEQPAPLADSTRRFLKPLVGIDPDSVRVFRGPVADQVAAANAADAVTIGENIFMSAAHTSDSPTTLGLLAHELTHVARQREPRFVPPLTRQPGADTGDEEHLARAVESRAARLARRMSESPDQSAAQVGPEFLGQTTNPPNVPTGEDFSAAEEESDTPQYDREFWGGLPAPWEPLPTWMETAFPAVESTEASAAPVTFAGYSNGGEPAMVQRAEIGRALDTSETTADSPEESATKSGQKPDQDLDTLARKVYAMLRQRLALERRRAES